MIKGLFKNDVIGLGGEGVTDLVIKDDSNSRGEGGGAEGNDVIDSKIANITLFGPLNGFLHDLQHSYTCLVAAKRNYSIQAFQRGLNHPPSSCRADL